MVRLKLLLSLILACNLATSPTRRPLPPSPTHRAIASLGVGPAMAQRSAKAIDELTQSRFERLLLVSVAFHESRFSERVASCKVRGDGGKATGLLQTWKREWRKACPPVKAQFAEALRHLRLSRNYCRRTFRDWTVRNQALGAVSLYATGKTCRWSGAVKRWNTMVRLGRIM